MVKAFWLERSNESKELVTAPVTSPVPSAVGLIVTVEVFTVGLSLSPSLEMPTPVTVYSHPVL